MVTVRNSRNIFIPAGSTIPTFVPLIGSRADLSIGRFSLALCQYHRRMLETSRCGLSNHMGGCTENEVLWQFAIFLLVLRNDSILPGWDPVKGSGSVLRHLADVPKVRHGLDVTRIVPAEVLAPLAIQQRNHGSRPSGILQALVSVLQSSLDDGEDIAALEGITALAYATLYIAEFGAGCTPLRRDTCGQSGHLRGLGKPTHDGIQILDTGRHGHGGILHGNGIRFSDCEIHGVHAGIIAGGQVQGKP